MLGKAETKVQLQGTFGAKFKDAFTFRCRSYKCRTWRGGVSLKFLPWHVACLSLVLPWYRARLQVLALQWSVPALVELTMYYGKQVLIK